MEVLILATSAVFLIVVLLLFFGLIGPKWLQNIMRRFNTFLHKDAALFFPLDPYKPISEAFKEGIENFLPTQQRLRNFLLVNGIFIFIALVGILIGLVLIIIYRP